MVEIKDRRNGKVLYEHSGETLEKADLKNQNLQMADLKHAKLKGADLRWANLSSAKLDEADLRNANLEGANLLGCSLMNANLCGANLTGVFFGGGEVSSVMGDSIVSRAILDGAQYDDSTQWPPNFDARKRGAVKA